ncbi:DEAD/DEAH box helicase [Parendozoicomonas haliclonae]|uniref:ATP-dependent RNA helicase RhlE n=1 Tax=Parendozoicomonas haliclonae TaxID=1960125 RepID=A0A1X7AMU3_9GAMM|nr:DEAD/DEAH box helicase [Parendozoicomonas haliclonae]SMA47693.1 ATP-dependent RNA helicase RhlE [Parendozoicomonas haliclonae]
MSFMSLGLSLPILKAVEEKGYTTPSPIQAQAIPAVLDGKDVMAAAQTGTGKTASFTLPLLERLTKGPRPKNNQARALVLTPTRELAAQVADSVEAYGKNLQLSSTVVFGGVKINPQMMRLRRGVDILVATPGRLLDLYQQNAIRFEQLEVLVLDEADRMLDMGFINDIRKILRLLPQKRQNLMFSATFSEEIRSLAKTIVNNPVEISVTPPNATARSVEQWIHPVDKKQKPALLLKLITSNRWEQVLVFSKTKHGANKLVRYLDSYGVKAAAIHGNKSQGARTKALADFKSGEINVLVATDIAARGLDISQLPQVVNFDLPQVAEDYVHRIGRTGRAGATGTAISLVCAEEFKLLSDIERLTQQLLDRKMYPGYEPRESVPESRLQRPLKPKKPKKPKQPRDNTEEFSTRPQNTERSRKPSFKNGKSNNGNGANGNAPRRGKTAGNKTGDKPRSGQPQNRGNSSEKPAARPAQRKRRPSRAPRPAQTA